MTCGGSIEDAPVDRTITRPGHPGPACTASECCDRLCSAEVPCRNIARPERKHGIMVTMMSFKGETDDFGAFPL